MKVRYYGHVGQPSGYGRAASDMCMALIRAGADLEIRPFVPKGQMGVRVSNPEIHARLRDDASLSACDVIIVHDLPGSAPKVSSVLCQTQGLDVDIPRVCYTTWEAHDAPPAILDKLRDSFDEVWVPSDANYLAFMPIRNGDLAKPVKVVPHAFDESSRLERWGSAGSERYQFYYVGAWNSRKNVAGLIRAWALAFHHGESVELVLQVPGAAPQTIAAAVGATGLQPDQMADIKPYIRHVSDAEILAMHATMSCFVTASRGEAWNLPAFDAMLARRHVIATKTLGSDDFLRNTSATMVDYAVAPACVDVNLMQGTDGTFRFERVGAQGLTSQCLWTEPDLVDLAGAMRAAFREKKRDLEVRYDPTERYGYEAVGKLALTNLQELLNR